ncbi:hypothetical protein [Variovorax sp. V213]|jgi:hypothetical protein|uniref:hypothetical protein n=1 Tax=Variovorax sp. V213 TaxID=3065955 RepID=UPI0034E8D597
MATSLMDFDLPEGWSCSVELELTTEGVYAGRAELRHEFTQCCVLVVTQQPTREAALECMKSRAARFVEEWNTRLTQAIQ